MKSGGLVGPSHSQPSTFYNPPPNYPPFPFLPLLLLSYLLGKEIIRIYTIFNKRWRVGGCGGLNHYFSKREKKTKSFSRKNIHPLSTFILGVLTLQYPPPSSTLHPPHFWRFWEMGKWRVSSPYTTRHTTRHIPLYHFITTLLPY